MTFDLEPLELAEARPDHFVATGGTPWLRLCGKLPRPGSWFRISYASSHLDHCVRPLIRFEGTDEWDVMRAPYFGRADWIGYYPRGAEGISLSPVNGAGPFRFKVEAMEQIFLPKLYLRAFKNDPKTALMSVGAMIIGAKKEMRQALMFARGGIGLSHYDSWRRHMTRPHDPAGLDAPYALDADLPHVRLVINFKTLEELHRSKLWASLRNQSHRQWSLAIQSPSKRSFVILTRGQERNGGGEFTTTKLTDGLKANDLLAFIPANATLPEFALACVAQAAHVNMEAEYLYGDSDEAESGHYHSPRLLPDWSPGPQGAVSYVGEPVFCRVNVWERDCKNAPALQHAGSADTLASKKKVAHIRRTLATTQSPSEEPSASACHEFRPTLRLPAQLPRVSIVIPSKDRIDLIWACLTSIQKFSDPPPDEIIIVDNDSDAKTLAYYASIGVPNLRVLAQPGPFNFSKMCNAGALEATGDVIIFLNNDVEAISGDWLSPLVRAALQEDVGVAGPLLLFPNERIQHAGVVVGMGGFADHVFQGEKKTYRGYLGKLARTHEVSAVTGAVMAMCRDRFQAVGGFDEDNFPVELNDIDLCLRFRSMGLKTVLCPESRLLHHQSGTRGFNLRPFQRYARERSAFRRKWSNTIQDDTCFHPSLSLFSTVVQLDG